MEQEGKEDSCIKLLRLQIIYPNLSLCKLCIYSRRHKKVPVPYLFYDRKTLSSVKRYILITGANRNYGSPIYSIIARFIRLNNARA